MDPGERGRPHFDTALRPAERRDGSSCVCWLAPRALLLADNTAARLAARAIGIKVHGSIAIYVRAMRRGRRNKEDVIVVFRDLTRKSSHFNRPSPP